ncbi:MAG: antibiotic biosynthesis monooxygenase [bacterium]
MSAGHYVVVTFKTTADNQNQAVNDIADYVATFLSQQPGFIQSQLLASNDGQSIVHQAQWTDEAAFQAAGVLARKHPDLPKLMVYEPKGMGYRRVGTFQAG